MTAAADRARPELHQHAVHLARSVLDRHEGIVDESRIVLVLGGITHNQGELRHHIFQIVYQKGGETIEGLELPRAGQCLSRRQLRDVARCLAAGGAYIRLYGGTWGSVV